jgi:hypothetical protein
MPRGLPGVLKGPGQWTEAEYREVVVAGTATLPIGLSFRELNRARTELGELAPGWFGRYSGSLDQWFKEITVLPLVSGHQISDPAVTGSEG